MQKESLAAREEMRKINEQIGWKEERFTLLVDKASLCWRIRSTKTGWQMRGWRQSFRDCKLEKKEEVAMHRRQVMAAWGPCGSNSSPWEQMELRPFVQRLQREMGAAQGQMPGREEGRRNSDHEQEQRRTSQQLGLPTPGGINQGAPASGLELDLPRVRMYQVKAEVQEDQAQKGIAKEVHPDHQDGLLWMRKRMMNWEKWCRKPKGEKTARERTQELLKKTVREGPSTMERHSQGKHARAFEGNSQGKDPRTLVENSKGANVSTYQINSQRRNPRTQEA